MKSMLIRAASAAFLLCAISTGGAWAQGVNRICVESVGANGSNNCVDVSAANPLPVTGGGSGGTVSQGTPGSSPWLVNESQINGATVPAGPGPSTSNTQRVTLSSDSPAPPAQKYTLVSGSNTTGTYTQTNIAGGAYSPNINATTFGGANVAVTYSQDGFSTTTTNYTANTITAQTILNIYQGTSVTAVVTGGPPTGLTISLAGGPAAGGGTQLVANANPATLYSNQQTVTASAVALPSQALVNGISIIALSTNTGTVYVGNSGLTTTNGYPLGPGQGSPGLAVQNLSTIYILGTNTTDKVAFVGN